MPEQVGPSLGLDIAAAAIVLLLIAFPVVRSWRKRRLEAEFQRMGQGEGRNDPESWVRPARPESGPPNGITVSDGASDEPPPERLGFMRRFGHGLVHLLDDRKPSGYSSISPRQPDGSRPKIFFFNGNGRGR